MADIPHFAYPLRYRAGAPVVNEQDTAEDVVDCVHAILATPLGHRVEQPDFGLADQAFSEGQADIGAINAAISRWEPRARPESEYAPSVSEFISTIQVKAEASTQ